MKISVICLVLAAIMPTLAKKGDEPFSVIAPITGEEQMKCEELNGEEADSPERKTYRRVCATPPPPNPTQVCNVCCISNILSRFVNGFGLMQKKLLVDLGYFPCF